MKFDFRSELRMNGSDAVCSSARIRRIGGVRVIL